MDDVLHRHVDVVNAAAGAGVRQLADRRDDGLLVPVVHTDRALVRSANLLNKSKTFFTSFFTSTSLTENLFPCLAPQTAVLGIFSEMSFCHTITMTYHLMLQPGFELMSES